MSLVFIPQNGDRLTSRCGRFQLLALVACALAPSVASAANINILDATDTLSVSGMQFEFGFSSTINQATESLSRHARGACAAGGPTDCKAAEVYTIVS